MKTVLNTLLATMALTMTLSRAPAQAEELFHQMKSETGDFCTDQALGHMRFLFGEEVEIKKVFSDGSGANVSYWFETNICEGHMIATFFRGSTCVGAHYGSVPLYMQRLSAEGSCQQVMSADSFPIFETTFPFTAIA